MVGHVPFRTWRAQLERTLDGTVLGRQAGWRRAVTVVAGVATLLLFYHVVFGQNGLTAYESKRREARALAQQVEALQRENAELQGHVERLQRDPSAIEHQAREELHYTRPGEVIYTLTDDAPAVQATAAKR
ncbi:MAG: septum formation initiator family protein [Acidobacteriota bacterium]|nr:septum formation initiator family protein [Acidobacteriota bacterium]